MLKTKSVHQEIEAGDGLRILAARFRGRGLSKERYEVWMPSLGPSERLLRAVQGGAVSWKEFSRLYKAEMLGEGAAEEENESIKNHGQKFTLRLLAHLSARGDVTLLCHCEADAPECHRHLLKALIAKV